MPLPSLAGLNLHTLTQGNLAPSTPSTQTSSSPPESVASEEVQFSGLNSTWNTCFQWQPTRIETRTTRSNGSKPMPRAYVVINCQHCNEDIFVLKKRYPALAARVINAHVDLCPRAPRVPPPRRREKAAEDLRPSANPARLQLQLAGATATNALELSRHEFGSLLSGPPRRRRRP